MSKKEVDDTSELLVQFTEDGDEDSAWIQAKFVPQRFVDEFEQRDQPEEPPFPIQS